MGTRSLIGRRVEADDQPVDLSILIASHTSRVPYFEQLVGQLTPQLTPQVEVVVYWNRGGKTIGEYRQALLEDARGEYVCFIDDDDKVPDYYCREILEALETSPDYVGFNLQYVDRARRGYSGVARHTIENNGWANTRTRRGARYERDITHLNPIRRIIALQGVFSGNVGEDRRWAESVRSLVESEVFVDRIMYFYTYDRNKSLRERRPEHGFPRPVLPEGFRYHPDSDS